MILNQMLLFPHQRSLCENILLQEDLSQLEMPLVPVLHHPQTQVRKSRGPPHISCQSTWQGRLAPHSEDQPSQQMFYSLGKHS